MNTECRITIFLLGVLLLYGSAIPVVAQDNSTPPAVTDEQQKDDEAKEKRAYALLEQTIDEAQFLKLPENRIRLEITAADLLWKHNEGRARSLFSLASDGVGELMRSNADASEQRRRVNQTRSSVQLRQELVLSAARHDAALAYQLLAATRNSAPSADGNNFRGPDLEDNLEQRLLAQVAALDPKMAMQNADQLLDKGQFPRALTSVLAQLQLKDKEAAAKLTDKMVKKLQSANMLANSDAATLALSLLQRGPRPDNISATVASQNTQVLSQSAYQDVMGTVIDAALRATPQAGGNQRGGANFRGRGGNGAQVTGAGVPTDAQNEQANARRLLGGLLPLLPQIEQSLPSRATAVRQKITELGIGNSPRAALGQVFSAMQQGTADSLLAAAPAAPPQMQSRIYQQAALKALDEGNPDRARQIANDHLEPSARDAVLQTLEFRQVAEKADSSKIDELRQTLSQLRSDDERISLLVQLASGAQQNNPKLALQILGEARQFVNRRATSYQQFEQQLKVADAYKTLEPARGFEVLEGGILQLNELLSAAATLSGFELNVFKDGELPLEGGSVLNNTVSRFGQELGRLAPMDSERAQTVANKFQLTEARIVAKLAIVRGMLGMQSDVPADLGFGPRPFGQNFGFARQPQ